MKRDWLVTLFDDEGEFLKEVTLYDCTKAEAYDKATAQVQNSASADVKPLEDL